MNLKFIRFLVYKYMIKISKTILDNILYFIYRLLTIFYHHIVNNTNMHIKIIYIKITFVLLFLLATMSLLKYSIISKISDI